MRSSCGGSLYRPRALRYARNAGYPSSSSGVAGANRISLTSIQYIHAHGVCVIPCLLLSLVRRPELPAPSASRARGCHRVQRALPLLGVFRDLLGPGGLAECPDGRDDCAGYGYADGACTASHGTREEPGPVNMGPSSSSQRCAPRIRARRGRHQGDSGSRCKSKQGQGPPRVSPRLGLELQSPCAGTVSGPASVFPGHEPHRLVRRAQHVALLEAGAEEAVDGSAQGLRRGLGNSERDLVAHGRPSLE
jgi:hypothetical protein